MSNDDLVIAPLTTLITLDGPPNNVVMSNGNLTVTRNNTSAGGVTSTDFLTDGQVYFEVTLLTSLSNSNSFGLISSSDPVTTPPGVGIAQKVAVLLGTSSSIIYTNKFVGGNTGIDLGPAAVGDVWGMAADIYFGRCWFRKNGGLWNGSGSANPATGSGGIDFDVRPGKAPYGGFAAGSNSTDVMKFNFGQGAFGGAPPSGFGPPDGSGGSVGGWYTFKLTTALAASPPITLDPGTTSSNVTLSNGNLTATHTSSSGNVGARSVDFQTAGKYYFEITVGTSAAFSNMIGILLSTGTYLNLVNNGFNCFSVGLGGGSIFSNNGSVAGVGSVVSGDVYGFAIDLNARLAWVRRNTGFWNGTTGGASANPATGVNGQILAAGAFAPVIGFDTGSGDVMTANFGATAYVNAAPSGFGKWPQAGWLMSPPMQAGYIHVRVRAAKPSTTYYIDPKITLS